MKSVPLPGPLKVWDAETGRPQQDPNRKPQQRPDEVGQLCLLMKRGADDDVPDLMHDDGPLQVRHLRAARGVMMITQTIAINRYKSNHIRAAAVGAQQMRASLCLRPAADHQHIPQPVREAENGVPTMPATPGRDRHRPCHGTAQPPAQPGKVRPRLGQALPDLLGVVPYERVTLVLIACQSERRRTGPTGRWASTPRT